MKPKTKSTLIWAGSILIGLVFILAALGKIPAVMFLERDIIGILGISPDTAAKGTLIFTAVSARLLIALELALGAMLLQPYLRRKVVLPACIGLLTIFVPYLVKLAFIDQSTGDCGCFGALLPMAPLPSLFKTVLMLVICLALWNKSDPDPKGKPYMVPAIALSALILVLAIAWPRPTPAGGSNYGVFTQFEDVGQVDMMDGVKIIAFLSLDCDHCKEAAGKLADLSEEDPPIYFVCLGSKSDIQQFRDESDAEYPWYLETDPRQFFQFIGKDTPRIVLLRDGKRLQYWDREEFTLDALREAWNEARREQ